MNQFATLVTAILLSFLSLTTLVEGQGAETTPECPPPPGDLVDVGGFKMHCLVKGKGPIVVCDASLGEASYDWASMQDMLAEFATVVCFDRAGVGWSEPGPLPRTHEKTVEELRVLLRKKKLDPPYVLVGNSYGGIDARLYASMYPKEVAGLVLVDAGYLDDFPENTPMSEMFGKQRGNPEQRIAFARQMDIRPFVAKRLARIRGQDSDEQFQIRVAMKSRVSELEGMAAERAGLVHFREACDKMRHLGDMPVTVLTATEFRAFKWWAASQKKLAETVSDDVEWIKVPCGHTIHHDRPDVVADAVKNTLERTAKKNRLSAPN